MNCPSRTDEILDHPGWNQNPAALAADLTVREDLNGIANLREQRGHRATPETKVPDVQTFNREPEPSVPLPVAENGMWSAGESHATPVLNKWSNRARDGLPRSLGKAWDAFVKFTRFVGPGFLIAVAYIDPGNYATDVAAGAVTQYSLLFIVLMSNFFAIFLQSLCIKLGSVTGRNLAENCRAHLPRWLTIILYVFSEAAIIATDMAEVIGDLSQT